MPKSHDISRYHRQAILPGIGAENQSRLMASHALLVGCGALGCTIADLLVRAGVGTLTIVDRDVVEVTNLQRQTLFEERDATDAMPKAEAAAKRLGRVNSGVKVNAVVADFTHQNAEAIAFNPSLARPAVLLDGTDNFATRYLLNDLAVKHSIALTYGGAVATRGMSMTFLPQIAGLPATPCLRCVFPDCPPPGTGATCDTAGILAPVSSMVGAQEAAEAIKVMIGRADLCDRSLREFDLWTNAQRRIDVGSVKDAACPACALHRFEFLEGAGDQEVAVICTRTGGGAVQVSPARDRRTTVDTQRMKSSLAAHGEFTANQFVLRGVLSRESDESNHPIELTVFHDGRAIIRGTTEPAVARSIYARYIGD